MRLVAARAQRLAAAQPQALTRVWSRCVDFDRLDAFTCCRAVVVPRALCAVAAMHAAGRRRRRPASARGWREHVEGRETSGLLIINSAARQGLGGRGGLGRPHGAATRAGSTPMAIGGKSMTVDGGGVGRDGLVAVASPIMARRHRTSSSSITKPRSGARGRQSRSLGDKTANNATEGPTSEGGSAFSAVSAVRVADRRPGGSTATASSATVQRAAPADQPRAEHDADKPRSRRARELWRRLRLIIKVQACFQPHRLRAEARARVASVSAASSASGAAGEAGSAGDGTQQDESAAQRKARAKHLWSGLRKLTVKQQPAIVTAIDRAIKASRVGGAGLLLAEEATKSRSESIEEAVEGQGGGAPSRLGDGRRAGVSVGRGNASLMAPIMEAGHPASTSSARSPSMWPHSRDGDFDGDSEGRRSATGIVTEDGVLDDETAAIRRIVGAKRTAGRLRHAIEVRSQAMEVLQRVDSGIIVDEDALTGDARRDLRKQGDVTQYSIDALAAREELQLDPAVVHETLKFWCVFVLATTVVSHLSSRLLHSRPASSPRCVLPLRDARQVRRHSPQPRRGGCQDVRNVGGHRRRRKPVRNHQPRPPAAPRAARIPDATRRVHGPVRAHSPRADSRR